MTITYQTQIETLTQIVSPEVYGPIASRIERIEARCEKKGYPAPSLEVTDIYMTRGCEVIDGNKYFYEPGDKKIILSLPTITVDGWTLAARVDFIDTETQGRKGLVSTVPGQTVPHGLHDIDETCEHCFKDRKRSRIYIFKNGEQWKRVGSTCIQDYIGLDAKMLLHCTEARTWFQSDEESFYQTAKYFGVTRYLASVATIIRKHGWEPSKGDNPTWNLALQLRLDLLRPFKMTPEQRREAEPTDADWKLATDAIEYYRGRDFHRTNDYQRNLSILADCPAIDIKRLPLAASMVVAYQKVLEQEIENERLRRESGGYAGDPGTKIKAVKVKIKSVRTFEGMYGTTTLYSMIDDANRVYVWYSSRNFDHVKTGTTQTVSGTIKAHKEYKGVPQTVVTRCKWA